MWFKLEATSCLESTDALKKYCEELSTFNIRVLHVPRRYHSRSGTVLDMDVLMQVELNTLEDFICLKDSIGKNLILHEDEENLIEIYDDWRE